VRAVGGRTLGKDCDVAPFRKDSGNFLVDDPGVPPATTAQKDRIVACRQPADQGPMPDLFLGNECGWQGGIDDVDVDPGNMVGHQQRTGPGMGQIRFEDHAEGTEQSTRPSRFQGKTTRYAAPWKYEQDDQRPAQHKQGEARQPEGTNQKIGIVQSACPK